MSNHLESFLAAVNSLLADHCLIVLLLAVALWFTWATRGVQFRMAGEMLRLLALSGKKHEGQQTGKGISSFQAFAVSIASRVGTGNLAGVAIAIAVGGPGAVFWMWIIALLGAATAFIESTLAQLYKVRGEDGYLGGPAFYILKGTGKRWWAVTFAVLITLTFGLAFNSVQSNTISLAFEGWVGVPRQVTAIVLTAATLLIVCGGIRSIARFSQIVVPVMAIGYILVALAIIIVNIAEVPRILALIVEDAFGLRQAGGGAFGMALVWGIKRGLFSNEAGEGSTPCAAAAAAVSHPAKQGLIQALGVFTDTLVICSATAFIILCSGVWSAAGSADGIVLTQQAVEAGMAQMGLRGAGSALVTVAVFFFAFTSIIANYYYGESNLRFILDNDWLIRAYRLAVGAMVWIGAVASLGVVWSFADVTMALMTICNLAALAVLGHQAVLCLRDYQRQRAMGVDPHYRSSTIPEIADKTECWRNS